MTALTAMTTATATARARAMPTVDGKRARGGAAMRRGRGKTAATAVVNAEDGFAARATRAARGNGALATTEEARSLRDARAPTNRNEEYRFTDFSALTAAEFEGPKDGAKADASGARVENAGVVVVLVDGALDAAQSDLEGAKNAGVSVSVGAGDAATGAQSAVRGNVFAAINAASATEVVVIRVAAGAKCAAPIHIVSLSTSGEDANTRVSAPRVTVVVEEGGELSLVEDFAGEGEGAYWQNGVCEITLSKGASLKHFLVQNHGRNATHTRTTLVTQEEESKYEVNEVSVGGKTALDTT